MENLKLIEKLFENLKCPGCDKFFAKGAIELIRREENNVIIKIQCTYCDKDLGLAFLGLDKETYKNSLRFENIEKNEFANLDFSKEPISYDEVIQAHDFFSDLGPDWQKHIPKKG